MQEGVGLVTLRLENVTPSDVERFRFIISTLVEEGVFNIRSGRAIMHFDVEGTLQGIDVEKSQWRRGKPSLPLVKGRESVIIESTIHP